MKKLISFLLAIVMTVSLAVPAFAEESEEAQYGTIKVEYSDARGTTENLDVMVLNGFVYTNVESFCSRMGYDVEQGEAMVGIRAFSDLWMDNSATLELLFCIDDTTVYYKPLCGIEIEYTAPAPCIQNEQGTWVLLSYTLNLLGGSRNIAGDVLVIHMPSPSILSVATVIAKNTSLLSFDWVDDFGYDENTVNKTDGAARIVTLFNGLLEFDGRSWSSFIDWDAFDKKFGKTLAAMLCTYSSDELRENIEEVEFMLDVFDDDGALGSMLRSQQTMVDSDVNAWEKICEEKLAQLEAGSGTLPQYNMAYQQYERATKKQDLFSAIGADDAIYIQDSLAEATNALKYATWIGYGVTYLDEFQQRDDFQATVLKNYFATRRKTEELDDATAQAIADYASSDIIEYTASKFFEEHALEILVDESGLDALMGVPANLLLLAWDIMSESVPFYSDGLKSVEAREISNYAQQVQTDAFLNFNDLLESLRADPGSITHEDCVQLAEYCYVYLKACYIARSSAIDSLKGISEEAQKKLQSKIDVETDINRYIAKYLAILGQADLENSCYILGFLPENNEELVAMYTDESIVDIVILDSQNQTPQDFPTTSLVSDAFSDYGIRNDGGVNNYRIPKVNISSEAADETNTKIYNDLYHGVYEKLENTRGNCGSSGIAYTWAENNGVISILTVWMPEDFTGHGPIYNQAYNISVETGALLTAEEVIMTYGYTLEEFNELAKERIAFRYEQLNEQFQEMESFKSDYEYYLEWATSEESLKRLQPYVSDSGDLCFSADIIFVGTYDRFTVTINLTGEAEPQLPVLSWNMPEEAHIDGWKELYIAYIEENRRYISNTYYSYAIAYVDNDNIPEIFLMCGSTLPGDSLLWISGDSVCEATEIGNYGIYYQEKQGMICTQWLGHEGIFADIIYSFNEGEITKIYHGIVSSGYDWDGKEVTQSQYEKYLTDAFDMSKAVSAYADNPIDTLIATIMGWQ